MHAAIASAIWAGSAVRSSIVCARAITAPSPAWSGSHSDKESALSSRIGVTASQPVTSPTDRVRPYSTPVTCSTPGTASRASNRSVSGQS